MTVRRMRIAWWITNTKDTHSEYVTRFFSTAEKFIGTSCTIKL